MKDIHGQAILDYYRGEKDSSLTICNSYGDPEYMPVEVFFRDELDFTTLEHLALIECEGKILDIGAGAGAHSLMLESLGKKVSALESSAGCVEVMKQSGISEVIYSDYREHRAKYDTLLLMMNGLGIAGTLANIPIFLNHCKRLLEKGGQILLDSSDISYLYDGSTPTPEGYYGEVRYQYGYKGSKGSWFDWVYVDQETLEQLVKEAGYQMEVLLTEENDQYLARISGF